MCRLNELTFLWGWLVSRGYIYNMLEGNKCYKKENSLTILNCAFILLIINNVVNNLKDFL